jgi:hypothetical protein
MTVLATIQSISWRPEIFGIIITVVAVASLCGTVYLLLGTNLGARLGLLVSLAGLFGWMATMGFIWWAYGIGPQGKLPVWESAGIIVNDADLSQLGIGPATGLSDVPAERAAQNRASLQADGWTLLDEDDPKRALAIAGSDAIVQNEAELLSASEYKSINVFDKGGERWPMLFGNESLDFLAFRHNTHYAIVEIAIVEPVYTEPGRAPRQPVVDENIQHKYVKMIRDLGDRRKTSAFVGIGSTIIFGVLCWMLHRRDRLAAAHRAAG